MRYVNTHRQGSIWAFAMAAVATDAAAALAGTARRVLGAGVRRMASAPGCADENDGGREQQQVQPFALLSCFVG